MDDSSDSGVACSAWDHSGCEGTPYCPPRCPRFVDKYGAALIVRPLEPADRDQLVAMYLDFPHEHRSMGLPPANRKQVERWVDRLVERGRNFVAVDDAVVGHAVYSPTTADVPEFAVFVHPDSHDLGIGSELTRHAIAYAASEGHEALCLDVQRDNHRAIHVYRRLGFEEVESPGVDVTMRLSLSHPTAAQVQLAPGLT
ncbi:GNAT family N-acetyltransferase [Halobacteriaceae archaeon GCM10025711]